MIDGEPWEGVVVDHRRIADGADVVFEMVDTPQVWGV